MFRNSNDSATKNPARGAAAPHSHSMKDHLKSRPDLLDPAELDALGGLELVARAVVTGFISGLHSSPSRGFSVEFAEHRAYRPGDDFRFVSSGCIRVQNVRDYIAFLLKETPGWDRAKIDETIASGERVNARIANPVPCYWVYITAWATPDGGVQFRDDIYNKDGLGPAAVAALQGDQDI